MAVKLKFVLSVVAKEALRKLGRDNGSLYAAAVAFFGLISLMPLMLFAVGVLGYLLGSHDEALTRVSSFARDVIPVGAEELERNLRVLTRQPGLLSTIGLVGFLWTGMQLFIIIEKVMNLALGAEQPKGFLRTRGIALIMAMATSALFALSIGITPLIRGISGGEAFAFSIARLITRMLIAVLALALVYKFLPARDIGTSGPVVGGTAAGVLFVVATYIFRWYAINIADYTEVYGTLAGVVILLLWIYYASLVIIIGAELASVYAQREDTAP